MRTYEAGKCDIAVIGAGHAGIEAALASARLGLETVCFAINLDTVGNMPCNPAIGGTGKGHLVRELDALGGEMARAADEACIQYRMLNLGKGPAVHSLRAQGVHRRPFAEVQHPVLDAGFVRRAGHLAPQGVQLPHEVALARAAYGRVAGHVAHRVEVYGKADRLQPQARRGQRGLYARVARAYDRYIAFSRFISSHNPKIILLPRGGIKLCRICTGKNASGYCFISLMW